MSKVIIITGMHRSGTSLISHGLQQAGVNLGEKLIAPNIANPRGFFEDVDFYEFHEQALHGRDQTFLRVAEEFVFEPTLAEREKATRLIEQRANWPVWGWKDPRTALFLDFWYQLLPQACFLFIYRHPLEVLLSLLKRGDFDHHLGLLDGLKAWYVYNTRIKRFYEQHREICILGHVYGIVDQAEAFSNLLRRRLDPDLKLEPAELTSLYQSQELRRLSLALEVEPILHGLYPQGVELYRQFEAMADLPALPDRSAARSDPDLALLARFILALPGPQPIPHVHGLLLLLMSYVEPELTEALVARYYQSTTGLEQKANQLWLELQRFERVWQEQKAYIEDQRAYIEQLTQERDRLWAEVQKLSQAWQEHKAYIEGQQAYIERLIQERDRQLQAYEQRLQSQDLMTRHYLKLTLQNLRDMLRHPIRLQQKLRRWFHYRVLNRDGAPER